MLLLIDYFIIVIQYLKKLNPTRAASEDSLKDVAISLCAVDRLLGNDENGNSATSAVLSNTNSLQVCGHTLCRPCINSCGSDK
jgi:hypothetical protein